MANKFITVGEGEIIAIGDPEKPIGFIEITKIRGDRSVRLGFSFPRSMEVNRRDIADQILEERRRIKNQHFTPHASGNPLKPDEPKYRLAPRDYCI